MVLFCAPASYAFSADLYVSDDGSAAGYVTLAWPDVSGKSFVLEEKKGQVWQEVYEGPDRATTLSGLPNGTYGFRLTADQGTHAIEVSIQHHSLARAWLFFAVGAGMFLLLVGMLLVGTRKNTEA